MSLSAPPGTPPLAHSAEPPPAVPGGLPRSGPERWRLLAAGAIVVAVVAAVWLWGRPASSGAKVLVAVTSEAWAAGQPPGSFDLVGVPEDVAARLAPPEALLDSLVTHDAPTGTFVVPALLAEPADAEGAVTSLKFAAATGAWPPPGPQAGSHAVIATVFGGCALDVTTLSGGGDGYVVVRLDAADTGRYAAAAELDGLVAWPAPPDGWPLCPQRRASAVVLPGGPLSHFEPSGAGPWSTSQMGADGAADPSAGSPQSTDTAQTGG